MRSPRVHHTLPHVYSYLFVGEMSPIALQGHEIAQEARFNTYLREVIRDAQGIPKRIVVRI